MGLAPRWLWPCRSPEQRSFRSGEVPARWVWRRETKKQSPNLGLGHLSGQPWGPLAEGRGCVVDGSSCWRSRWGDHRSSVVGRSCWRWPPGARGLAGSPVTPGHLEPLGNGALSTVHGMAGPELRRGQSVGWARETRDRLRVLEQGPTSASSWLLIGWSVVQRRLRGVAVIVIDAANEDNQLRWICDCS